MNTLPQTPSRLTADAARRRVARQELSAAIVIALVVHLVVPAVGAAHRNCVNRRQATKALR